MNHAIPDSLVRYQHALEDAIRRDLGGAAEGGRSRGAVNGRRPRGAAEGRRPRQVGVRVALAGAATAAVALGALGLLLRNAPTTAQPAAAAILRQAEAALARAPGTLLHIKFTGIQDNGDGTTVTWSQESFSEQTPPYDTRLIDVQSLGSPAGVEQATVDGVSQVYDPTRNTIYIGPRPSNANVHHYKFSRGPAPGSYVVHVPVAYRLSAPAGNRRAERISTIYRTITVTGDQAKALRKGTDVVITKRQGNRHRITEMRVAPAPPTAPADSAGGLNPFSSTFRAQILHLLRSGQVHIAGHVTVDGRDTIKITSSDDHTTYYVTPDRYTPVELTTKGTTGGTVLRFDTYEQLPVKDSSALLSLTAQHPTATIDRDAADYRAAETRLFPHG
jgi:hypothetical protein